ncbi:MAG: hypothetical protein FJ304_18600 [Planctomycetes bacterium]|nr:hypothetical protein [Planctomycetota bacterium]
MCTIVLLTALTFAPAVSGDDTPEVRAAVAALEKLGAKVSRHEMKPGKPIREVHFPRTGCEITDDDLKHLAPRTDVEWLLLLGQKKVTGDGLKHLTKLPNLKHIDFSKTPITGENLAHLSGMKQLVRLGLWDTAVDDAGLAHLAELKELKYLFLTNAKIGDAGLKNLGEKPNLRDLRLGGTLVTDDALPIIKKQFPKVGYITAEGSKLTPAGAELGKKLGIMVDFTQRY